MPPLASTPSIGETLRLEGESFTIDATEVYRDSGDGRQALRPGVMHANLPPNVEKMERKQYDIFFNAADAVWSDKHNAWCLRGRGVYVHPDLGGEVPAGLPGAIWHPDTF